MRYIKILILLLLSSSVFSQTTQFLGAPNTKVQNRGDFQVDSILYVPITLVSSRVPSQVGALRYRASDSSLYQWTGTAWRKTGITPSDTASMLSPYLRKADTTAMLLPYLRKSDTTSMLSPYVRNAGYGLTKVSQTLSADSLLLSTRAWRQKGVDSVASLPRVTSVAAGTGMSFTTITTTGSVSADTVALATRAWRQKGIDSLANVRVGGSGTTNRVAKFTASGTLGNSSIADSASSVAMTIIPSGNIGVGLTAPEAQLHVNNNILANGTITANNASATITARVPGSDAQQVRIRMSGTNGVIGTTRAGGTQPNLIFETEGTERMRLTAAGRLLVGTTTEGTNTVDIAGTLRSTQGANFATSSGGVRIGDATAANRKLDVIGGNAIISNATAANDASYEIIALNAGTDATLGALGMGMNLVPSATASSRRANISIGDNTGFRNLTFSVNNVGISTNTPAYKLDVNGDLRTTTNANFATSSGGVRIGDATSAVSKLQVVDAANSYSVHISGNNQTNGIAFGTLSNNAAIIQGYTTTFGGTNDIYMQTVANNVKIGGSTNAPSEKLDVEGRVRVRTIDSTSSPINMLWADNNGVIRKTSAPVNYGTFSDTTTQGITSANTEQAINFGVTEDTLGVFVSNSSRINVRKAGTYLVTFSAQVTKTDAGTDDIFFWVKKNGNSVARTASKIQLDGNGAEQLVTVTYIFTLAANDYIELFMQSPDEDCELLYATASGNIPVIPSIILTINQVK